MIFSVFNNKGGSGKTTTVVNVATAMAMRGKKVLIIDLDTQCNASGYAGTEGWSKDDDYTERTVYDLFFRGSDISTLVHKTAVENLYCIPSSKRMMNGSVRISLNHTSEPSGILYEAIRKDKIQKEYDHIFLDCAPAIDTITMNALNAAEYCIVPTQTDGFNMDGIIETLRTIEIAQTNGVGTVVKLLGVILCHYRSNTGIAQRVAAEIRDALPEKVFDTTIRMAAAIQSSTMEDHRPLVLAYPKEKATAEYIQLSREIIEKIGEDL